MVDFFEGSVDENGKKIYGDIGFIVSEDDIKITKYSPERDGGYQITIPKESCPVWTDGEDEFVLVINSGLIVKCIQGFREYVPLLITFVEKKPLQIDITYEGINYKHLVAPIYGDDKRSDTEFDIDEYKIKLPFYDVPVTVEDQK